MTNVAKLTNLSDQLVEEAERNKAVSATYEEIARWCDEQRRPWTRFVNWLLRRNPMHPSVPLMPLNWRFLVMIKPPEQISEGGIVLVQDTQDAEQYLTYVGKVVAKGRLVQKAVTRAKLNLRNEYRIKLGDIVVFYKNAGTRFATVDGHMFVLLSDTEIFGTTDDPQRLDTLRL